MSSSSIEPSSTSVLIVGCGTWGASTALHLARRGYKNVKVLDPYPVPSPISAGNDVNKIVEQGSFTGSEDNEGYVNNRLLTEATEAWLNDPVFTPYYHDTGLIIAASKPEHIKETYEREQPTPENGYEPLESAEAFRRTMPEGVLTGDFPNWYGWIKRKGCGWVHARKALVSAAMEAQRLGVTLVTGSPHGNVKSLIFEHGDVKGAITADGTQHRADRTILCAGATAPQLIDLENQLRPTAWTLAHIKMTPEETKLFKNLPVLFNVERGFFMEPDEDNNELKICDEHPGYCNLVKPSEASADECIAGVSSVPFARHQIPLVSEQGVRLFLRETMPQLADRPFSFARVCWCADTPNRAFLITPYPSSPSLTLGVGGSGHGFMHIPTIGGYIADCMEGKLDPRMQESWRWRPETAVDRDWNDAQGRTGGSYNVLDFQDIKEDEWTTLPPRDYSTGARL